MTKHKVLSTKKLDVSLVEKAKEKDIEIVCHDFITIEPALSEEKFKEFSSSLQGSFVVFTSSNAVEIISRHLQLLGLANNLEWKIFCIGGKTKQTILKYLLGIEIIDVAENAGDLAQKIVQHKIDEVLFFCGNQRRNELPDLLKSDGVKVNEIQVYNTVATPVDVQDKVGGILFFSPSAVQSFFSVNNIAGETICFAVGQTTAESIRIFAQNKIITSKEASQQSVLSSVFTYFQNINCYE